MGVAERLPREERDRALVPGAFPLLHPRDPARSRGERGPRSGVSTPKPKLGRCFGPNARLALHSPNAAHNGQERFLRHRMASLHRSSPPPPLAPSSHR